MRLELMGAILSVHLAQIILKTSTIHRVVYWTVSENVWYWVRNQSREFKPFMANWLGEIQWSTNPDQWHHVPGVLNPADLATRGLTVQQSSSTFWTEGPKLLKHGVRMATIRLVEMFARLVIVREEQPYDLTPHETVNQETSTFRISQASNICSTSVLGLNISWTVEQRNMLKEITVQHFLLKESQWPRSIGLK